MLSETSFSRMTPPLLEQRIVELLADDFLPVVATQSPTSTGLKIPHALFQASEVVMMRAATVGAAMSELSKFIRCSLPAKPRKQERFKAMPMLLAVDQLEQASYVKKRKRIGRVGTRHVCAIRSIASRPSRRLRP
jgi:hypothetical protein